MFIASLFKIVKIGKQPKYPLITEWIKMWYVYNGILLSHKKEIICDNMDESRQYQAK